MTCTARELEASQRTKKGSLKLKFKTLNLGFFEFICIQGDSSVPVPDGRLRSYDIYFPSCNDNERKQECHSSSFFKHQNPRGIMHDAKEIMFPGTLTIS